MIHLSRWKVVLLALSLLFGLLFSYPNLLTAQQREALPGWLPSSGLNLGLDLQGGSYLLLEVDVPAMRAKKLSNLGEDARTVLAEARVGVLSVAGDPSGVVVTLAQPSQMELALQAMRTLTQTNGGLSDRTVTRQGAERIRYAYTDVAMGAMASDAVAQSIEVVRRRVDKSGTKEISITRQGADRIVIQAPGQSDPEALERIIGQTAQLTFQMVDVDNSVQDALAGAIPPDSELIPGADDSGAAFYLVKRRVLVSGENLTKAEVTSDQNNQTAIGFRFDGAGARRFGEATAANIGRPFAIILDGKVISAPTIISAITGGTGQITGSYTIQEASEMVNLLNGGALPAPLKVEERRTVTAGLGADAVAAGKLSTLIGFLIIVVFMFGAYGLLFGGISVLGLILNGLLIIAAMSVTQATLTLPGIAGLVLTFAVAVDANVLIYERMRDEARSGRSVIASMDAGFGKAWGTIMDANVTTLVAAAIMFAFGAGPVRGFAWTLSIGVVTSMLSAILTAQVLLAYWLKVAKPKKLPIADAE
ncbi:MAG: protein translocase subunit SecD [Brevundimonas sp.]